jgi:hypothetical protein
MPHKSIPTRAGSFRRVQNALRRSPQKKIKAKLNNMTDPLRCPCCSAAANENEKILYHETIAKFVHGGHNLDGYFY